MSFFLEEIRRKLEKKHEKRVVETKINEIIEELNIDDIKSNLVNNDISKPEEFSESSFGFILGETTSFEETILTRISQMGYIVNIDGTQNREHKF